MYVADTIAAIATPPGVGGIGIIRISGPDARFVAERVFTHRGTWQSHRLYRGQMHCDGSSVDEGMAVLMRAPHSYTGEDVVELHCHGSPAVLRHILAGVLAAGARPAAPGEFTRRAFLNGKLDLAQAEAVIDLVHARTGEAAAQAFAQLSGRLSEHLEELRRRLIRVKAHLEVQIDFSEEEVDLDPEGIIVESQGALDSVRALLATYAHGKLVREGIRIAIVGRPNVGKSSLLNALLGEERAIVTSVPGTTRDVIEESIDIGGVPVILSDTAGLRAAPDEVERIGVERAQGAARAAEIVLAVLDSSIAPEPPPVQLEPNRTVVVLGKSDLPCRWSAADIDAARRCGRALVRVSAKEMTGLDDLRRVLLECIGAVPRDALPVLTRARHRDALVKVEESLTHVLEGMRRALPPDLVAVDVQNALDHIGTITGAVSSEDVLDAVFAEFCIGK